MARSGRRHGRVPQRRRRRHVGVVTVIEHLWRAATGVMRLCFSTVGVSNTFECFWRAASGVICKCFNAVGVGTVFGDL